MHGWISHLVKEFRQKWRQITLQRMNTDVAIPVGGVREVRNRGTAQQVRRGNEGKKGLRDILLQRGKNREQKNQFLATADLKVGKLSRGRQQNFPDQVKERPASSLGNTGL